jgi:bifunctional non-homologous end joining protein LigD
MEGETSRRAHRGRAYAIKKHHATRLHYDLRLEWNGVLLSWALPEGPSCHVGELRRAIEMEDHKSEYLLFEGLHITGPIMLWDRGTWEPHPESDDIDSGLRKGFLRFTLRGEKLKGDWTLTRMNSVRNVSRPIWTLCKQANSFVDIRADKDILEEQANSVSTGRTMEEIVRDWTKSEDRHERQIKFFE